VGVGEKTKVREGYVSANDVLEKMKHESRESKGAGIDS